MERVGVGALLLRQGQVLLARRAEGRTLYPGVWDTPGGHWVEGETYEQTLRRELREELGVVPLEYRLLGIIPDSRPDLHGEGSYYIYLVTKWDGVPRNRRPDEHAELAWVGIHEIETLTPIPPGLVNLVRSMRSFMTA